MATNRPLEMPVMLRQYKIYVTEGLDDEDTYDTDALLALIERDGIEDRSDKLSEDQKRHLFKLDEILASKHERVADVLPTEFSYEEPYKRWWWRLHEGPRVREEALSLKK